jgi:hypothetical protein
MSDGYLIYCCFESTAPKVAGSLLLDKAATEEEAILKVAMYKNRVGPSYETRYIYIKNQPHWWS